LPTDTEHFPLDPSSSRSSNHDDSDHVQSLPRPELNPLLNPLLGDNMGRWAEVYFRNPPENREEAVLELLRELKSKSQTGQDRIAIEDAAEQHVAIPENTPTDSREDTAESHMHQSRGSTRCETCGYESIDQRFCGMCGRPLQQAASQQERELKIGPLPGVGNAAYTVSAPPDSTLIDSTQIDSNLNNSTQTDSVSTARNEPAQIREAGPNTSREIAGAPAFANDLSIFRRISDPSHDRNSDAAGLIRSLGGEPEARSHRFYLIAVVLIALLGLGYFAWRSAQNPGSLLNTLRTSQPADKPGTDQGENQPVPPASPDTQPQNAPVQNTGNQPTSASAADRDGEDRGVKTAGEAATSAPDKTNAVLIAKQPIADPTRSRTPSQKKSENPGADAGTTGNGSEELAIAQRYLNGSAGQKNDAEARDWLWKAVSKRNLEATLLLADLYLRGNVVQKNCDQARVLLDAAATRGVKDAATRLRNMQAFGCQ
jgi:hypothetical protein